MISRSTKSQMLRYGVVGIGNMVVGASIVFGLHQLAGASIPVANIVGYGAGLCLSYCLNRIWTFDAKSTRAGSAWRFGALVCVALAANIALTTLLTGAGLPYTPSQLLGMVTYSVLVFFGSKTFVFPPQKEAAP